MGWRANSAWQFKLKTRLQVSGQTPYEQQRFIVPGTASRIVLSKGFLRPGNQKISNIRLA